MLGGAGNIRCERAYADFIGTKNGVGVRVRVELWMDVIVPLLIGMAPYGHVWLRGTWAPTDRFEEFNSLATAVQASLWETPEWRRRVLNTTRQVLDYRQQVFERAAQDWDDYIRGLDRVRDPETGEEYLVPIGTGAIVKGQDGKAYRLPEGAQVPAGMQELRPAR
jgi:hypothetical protein